MENELGAVQARALARFTRAWQLVKNNRLLWALGFLAALSGDLLSGIRIGADLNLVGAGELVHANILDIDSWLRALRLLGTSVVVAAVITGIVAVALLALVLAAKAGLVQNAIEYGPSWSALAVNTRRALGRGAGSLGTLMGVTVWVWGPYLLAAEIFGEVLRLLPGLLKLPLYLILFALAIVAIFLPYFYALALAVAVLDGCSARQAIERGWQMVRSHRNEMLITAGILLMGGALCAFLAGLVLSPVAGVSLLSLLLTALRGAVPNIGQVLGLIMLGLLSTALLAPVPIFSMLVLSQAYQDLRPVGPVRKPGSPIPRRF